MAGSMYSYVRKFELPDSVLPNTYMVVRIDGKGFHKFSDAHAFVKPNDGQALELMNEAARHVMNDMRPDITLAFGESDEYSFLLRKSCSIYKRRQSKLVSHIVSLFTSAYVYNWNRFFPSKELKYPPSFDGRLVVYPTEKEVRDYFAWRQADTHINNLYNTTFWAIVLGGESEQVAHERLKGTISAQKNEILFKQYNINYDRTDALFRKGTTLVWDNRSNSTDKKAKAELRMLHVDIIGSAFWTTPDAKLHSEPTAKEHTSEATSNGILTTLEVWQQPCRVTSTDGLGRAALYDQPSIL